jgi:hypothetical protein
VAADGAVSYCEGMIDNPQPAWLPLLLFAIPGLLYVAAALNRAIFPNDDRPLCTIPAVALVLALLPTHILALAFGSLSTGLSIAWSSIGAAGYVLILRARRRIRPALLIERSAWTRLGIAALSTMPIVLPTILLNFHDEAYFNEHFAMIAHLQNGTYPPRYLYEPSLPLRYHYGFDIAGAIVTGLLRVRLDQAVDFLTLALWPCMFLLLWRVGENFGGARAGLFTAFAVCFSGGWPMLARNAPPCGLCTINELPINPPFISYYFQHPWSLGVPVFCLVILQWAALPRLRVKAIGYAALVCSLSLLSLCQVVLFVTTIAAMALAEVWSFVRSRNHEAMTVLAALGGSLLDAKLIGGFFVSGNFPPAGGLFGTGFHVRDFLDVDAVIGQLQWNVASFGALLVLGVFGLRSTSHGKTFLIMLAVVALVIVNTLRYEYTWDIVKFGTVGFIALGIGAGQALSELAVWADNRSRKLVYALIVIALVGRGIAYPFVALSAYDADARQALSIQMIRPYLSTAYPVDHDDARAVSFLRAHMAPNELVYRTEAKSEPYAVWGGLPTQASIHPVDSRDNDQYGLGNKLYAARLELVSVSETWLDRLSAAHVGWIVTDPDDAAINTVLHQSNARGRVVLAARYGKVKVFRMQ